MFWDPHDRYNRNSRQRRVAEQEAARRARAEEEKRLRAQAQQEKQQALSPDVIARFQEELAQARRERDEWADRYDQLMASLDEQRAALEAEREQLEAEREQQQEQLRAEAEAQRERLLRNAEQRAFEENRKALLRMLEVADNLDRALTQLGPNEESPLAEGLRLTHRDFRRALAQSGAERMDSVGEPFDPALHEAVASLPSNAEPGTVLEEVAPGYLYRGTLLRPARVVVAA
ncbi:MAG: nucleotide exchange factor GrpE [Chloroflexota bacterium]|nr:nucleotide exchange factor GrpE [Chloroflexota bacterium]